MVNEHTLLCKQCRNLFKLPLSQLPQNKEEYCPACGSSQVEEAPAWAPLGSGLNIFDESTWEYECQQCKKKFKMPIPKSPTEDKSRQCPDCGSGHLHRLTSVGGEPLYCG